VRRPAPLINLPPSLISKLSSERFFFRQPEENVEQFSQSARFFFRRVLLYGEPADLSSIHSYLPPVVPLYGAGQRIVLRVSLVCGTTTGYQAFLAGLVFSRIPSPIS